jgi:pilus assembly protein CpaD
MTSRTKMTTSPLTGLMRSGGALLLVTAAALSLGACKTLEENTRITGWSVVDPNQRHPILVSQQPSRLVLKVGRGSYGLSASQRANLIGFAADFRTGAGSNSKLVIQAPSGGPNEVAAMQVVAEIRHILRESGFDETLVAVEAYHDDNDPQPPVRVSYLRYVASQPDGLNQQNFGCAAQKNLAAMVANPADLLGPRGETARAGGRRDVVWDKYKKGESSTAQKAQDEKAKSKGSD